MRDRRAEDGEQIAALVAEGQLEQRTLVARQHPLHPCDEGVEFGAANVVTAVLHRDEETPHLHIVEKTIAGKESPEPRLCARDITGRQIIPYLLRGDAVTLVPVQQQLTTQ